MLSAHMDTVPICAGARPVRQAAARSSRPTPTPAWAATTARAAPCLLATALAILEQKLPHPPLTFLWTVQEEAGLQRRPLRAAADAEVADAGVQLGRRRRQPRDARRHRRLSNDHRVDGIASHAGVHPERGVSAIAIASLAIADLVNNGWHGLIDAAASGGTSNVGVIHGGAATNVVTDRVELRAEARSHDPKFRERIVREIEKAFDKAAKEVRNVDGTRGA